MLSIFQYVLVKVKSFRVNFNFASHGTVAGSLETFHQYHFLICRLHSNSGQQQHHAVFDLVAMTVCVCAHASTRLFVCSPPDLISCQIDALPLYLLP